MRQVEASMKAYESHRSIESNTYTQTHKDIHQCDDAQEFQNEKPGDLSLGSVCEWCEIMWQAVGDGAERVPTHLKEEAQQKNISLSFSFFHMKQFCSVLESPNHSYFHDEKY